MLPPVSMGPMSLDHARWQANRLARQVEHPSQTAGGQTAGAAADGAGLGPVAGKEKAEDGRLGKQDSKKEECRTCKNRKYQDGSDDPCVSFKSPGKIDPDVSRSVVASHEHEHVVRERIKAEQEGRKVVSQSVSIHTATCPECGRSYVSGGVTRTVTKPDNSKAAAPEQSSGKAEKAGGETPSTEKPSAKKDGARPAAPERQTPAEAREQTPETHSHRTFCAYA